MPIHDNSHVVWDAVSFTAIINPTFSGGFPQLSLKSACFFHGRPPKLDSEETDTTGYSAYHCLAGKPLFIEQVFNKIEYHTLKSCSNIGTADSAATLIVTDKTGLPGLYLRIDY